MRYYNLLRNISNWWLYLLVKFGMTSADPLLFRTREGVAMEVPRRLLQTFKEIFMDECYLKGMEMPVPAKPVILDVGANAGYFSFFAASRFPGARIVACEPVPANFALLDLNRKLNPRIRMECLPVAVAGHSGEATLAFDPDDSFTTSATILRNQDGGRTGLLRVSAGTIPDILSQCGLERLDLLKMDCEGSEYDVLYNCPEEFLSGISQIAMEVHKGSEAGQDMDSLETYLNGAGFTTRRRPGGMMWAWRR